MMEGWKMEDGIWKMESKLLLSDTTFCQHMIEGWLMAGLMMTGIVIADAHVAISIPASLQ